MQPGFCGMRVLVPQSRFALTLTGTEWGVCSPMLVCMSALAVVSGTGMVMTTLSAKSLLLKPAFTFVFTSIRVRPSSVIRGVTCTTLCRQRSFLSIICRSW